MQTTTYLMRQVTVEFRTILLEPEVRLCTTCKLNEQSTLSQVSNAISSGALSFLDALKRVPMPGDVDPGDLPLVQMELEYSELRDDSDCGGTAMSIDEIETIEEGRLSHENAIAALVRRGVPRFERKLTLITFFEGGAK